MKAHMIWMLALLLVPAAAAAEVPAELLRNPETEKPVERKLFEEDSFSFSSDELDPSESLNRVAGEIDLGFAKPEQTFDSEKQKGPLTRMPTSTQY